MNKWKCFATTNEQKKNHKKNGNMIGRRSLWTTIGIWIWLLLILTVFLIFFLASIRFSFNIDNADIKFCNCFQTGFLLKNTQIVCFCFEFFAFFLLFRWMYCIPTVFFVQVKDLSFKMIPKVSNGYYPIVILRAVFVGSLCFFFLLFRSTIVFRWFFFLIILSLQILKTCWHISKEEKNFVDLFRILFH